MKATIYILLFLITSISLQAQIDSLRTYYQKGVSAYEEKNYLLYLDYFERANEIRPNHPTITYNLASGYALNGEPEKCLTTLRQLVSMNTKMLNDVKKDPDFTTVIGLQAFGQIEDLIHKLSREISSSHVELDISLDSTHIEGVAYNSINKEYFLGSVNSRVLFSYSESTLKELIGPSSHPNLYAILGVTYDPKSNSIWVCSAALPQMQNFVDSLDGYSSVLEYSLDSKEVTTEIVLQGNSVLGDLIITNQGEVLISDGRGNKIYSTRSGETMLTTFLDLSDVTFNLQGLTLSENQKFLFIADYITGIHRINMNDQGRAKIHLTDQSPEKGIDGLYFHNNSLIAIQNGTSPFRVVELQLNLELNKVVGSRILDQGRSELNEPTQGVFIGNDFIYIANSPWGSYTKQNVFTSSENLLLLSNSLQK